jgi:hypothetical protein
MQLLHVAPPVPQLPFMVPGWQIPPELQQPFGHDVASHTQLPPTQRRPLAHAGVVPHRQAPFVEQPSAVTVLHATQVPPFAPQVAVERPLQAPPAQHPFGQVVASQTQLPLTHIEPAPQAAP